MDKAKIRYLFQEFKSLEVTNFTELIAWLSQNGWIFFHEYTYGLDWKVERNVFGQYLLIVKGIRGKIELPASVSKLLKKQWPDDKIIHGAIDWFVSDSESVNEIPLLQNSELSGLDKALPMMTGAFTQTRQQWRAEGLIN